MPVMLTPAVDTSLQERATELMPALTVAITKQLINGFFYLVPVTISLPDRLEHPTVHFKTHHSIYARAVNTIYCPPEPDV